MTEQYRNALAHCEDTYRTIPQAGDKLTELWAVFADPSHPDNNADGWQRRATEISALEVLHREFNLWREATRQQLQETKQ